MPHPGASLAGSIQRAMLPCDSPAPLPKSPSCGGSKDPDRRTPKMRDEGIPQCSIAADARLLTLVKRYEYQSGHLCAQPGVRIADEVPQPFAGRRDLGRKLGVRPNPPEFLGFGVS